jgi:hypothetical protein
MVVQTGRMHRFQQFKLPLGQSQAGKKFLGEQLKNMRKITARAAQGLLEGIDVTDESITGSMRRDW